MPNKVDFEFYHQFYKSQLLDDCIPFWLNSELIDHTNGGYTTSVTRYGKVYDTDKSVWFQGRCLWTFSALCNTYGPREEWLDAARIGYEFLNRHCIDDDGRMFFKVTADGKKLRKRRYMFSESFYVVGMAEYGFLMKSADMKISDDILEKSMRCFDMMLTIYRDSAADPFDITPKEFSETRSGRAVAVPMVLVSCAQVLRRCCPDRAEYYSRVVDDIAGDMFKYFYKPELRCVLETVGTNGEFLDIPAGRLVNPGHTIENSWFLMNAALYPGADKAGYIEKALNFFDWSVDIGKDSEHGGYHYFVDCKGLPCEPLESDMKLWWVHCETLIASLMAYSVTKDEKYWNIFLDAHEYCEKHFHDNEFGEWFGYLHRDGSVSHTQKGSQWKGPYHLPRALMCCERILKALADGDPTPMIL